MKYVNTIVCVYLYSSAPTECVCGWSPSRLFSQMGNIPLATRIKHKNSEKYQGKSPLHPVKLTSNRSNQQQCSLYVFPLDFPKRGILQKGHKSNLRSLLERYQLAKVSGHLISRLFVMRNFKEQWVLFFKR